MRTRGHNPHERCLGRAQDYFSGALTPAEAADFAAHRDACGDCARLLARWPHAAAVPDLAPAVLAHLRVPAGRTWWTPLAAGLALALLLTAFWHPERTWLRDDKGYSDTCRQTLQGGRPCCLN